jgi:hypothetical protein
VSRSKVYVKGDAIANELKIIINNKIFFFMPYLTTTESRLQSEKFEAVSLTLKRK